MNALEKFIIFIFFLMFLFCWAVGRYNIEKFETQRRIMDYNQGYKDALDDVNKHSKYIPVLEKEK